MSALRLLSDLAGRAAVAAKGGITFGGKRDLFSTLGYKRILEPKDYRARYERNGIAARVVETFPQATWKSGTELIEDDDPDVVTRFEEAWEDLQQRLQVWSVFARLDVLAGLGRYALLLIGMPGELGSEAPPRLKPDQIAYLTPVSEESVTIKTWENDTANPRFGLPLTYEIKDLGGKGRSARPRSVHWSRVLHVVDGMLDDRVYGTPRLDRVWNYFDDLEKVAGGGAEAFWKRADQGIHVNLDPEKEIDPAESKKLEEAIDDYIHGLRRVIGTVGAEMNVLGSDTANFSNPVDAIITLIAGATGIPKRILVGSERGELASSQDKTNFDERVSDRRRDFAEPMVVRPFVDVLIERGALPKPAQYKVHWPEIEELDEAQKASVAAQLAGLNQTAGDVVITAAEIRDKVLRLGKLEDSTDESAPDQVFTGVQIQAATTIIQGFAQGAIPQEAAQAMLEVFLNVAPEDASRMLIEQKVTEPTDVSVAPPSAPPPEGQPPSRDQPPSQTQANLRARKRLLGKAYPRLNRGLSEYKRPLTLAERG